MLVCRLLFFVCIGLNPDEAVAKTVEGYVAVALCWFGLRVKPRERCVEAAALLVVIDHYVFAACQCLRVKILNSDTIGGWLVSCVDSKLLRGHLLSGSDSLPLIGLASLLSWSVLAGRSVYRTRREGKSGALNQWVSRALISASVHGVKCRSSSTSSSISSTMEM